MKTVSILPPYSLILVMDPASGIIPQTMGKALVSATESCVAVGCLSEYDGPTKVHLGQTHEVTPTDPLVFVGEVFTPNNRLCVCSVMNEELLSSEVAGRKTHIRVFANNPKEPDIIIILFDR